MLKYVNDKDNSLLKNKKVNILITNNCNLSCGGCHQLCGVIKKFHKSKIWNISIKQLEYNIKTLTHPKGTNPERIGIFGGETTLHPQWNKIIETIYSYPNIKFDIWTNGTSPQNIIPLDNVCYKIGEKTKTTLHQSTLMAACDKYKITDKMFYWKLAHENCRMWKNCRSVIYNNRCYLCEPAAAFDWIKLGEEHWGDSKGWKVVLGENPFDQHSKDIENQGKHFCYRCGFCLEEKKWQKVSDPDFVSDYNKKLLEDNSTIGENSE